MAKKMRGILKYIFQYYFLNIIMNINYFCDLDITVNTTLKY